MTQWMPGGACKERRNIATVKNSNACSFLHHNECLFTIHSQQTTHTQLFSVQALTAKLYVSSVSHHHTHTWFLLITCSPVNNQRKELAFTLPNTSLENQQEDIIWNFAGWKRLNLFTKQAHVGYIKEEVAIGKTRITRSFWENGISTQNW